MRPIIGITIGLNQIDQIYKIDQGYSRAIEQAGGLPLLLPIANQELIEQYIELIDGLFLSGGGDFAPDLFGEQAEPVTCNLEPQRDIFEISLIRAAWSKRLPILAICRGMQGLNISLGGSIYQDLSYAGFKQIDHCQKKDMTIGSHLVNIKEEKLAQIFGKELLVNSSHHQAIKKPAPQLLRAATAPDGIIEAIVAKDQERYAIGLQWHPEILLPGSGIFADFVEYIKKSK